MAVLLFVASIWLAAIGAWWASALCFLMGLACAHDYLLRQREAVRHSNRRVVAELDRNHRDKAA